MSAGTRTLAGAVLAALIAGFVGLVVASGDDRTPGTEANDTDGAFLVAMAAYHDTALAIAALAPERTRDPVVRNLAERISSRETAEVDLMSAAHQRIFGLPLSTSSLQYDDLGISPEEAAMDIDPARLSTASSFDREFLETMLRHHRGAVRVAEAEMKRGGDAKVRQLAERIATTRTRESAQIRSRLARYEQR